MTDIEPRFGRDDVEILERESPFEGFFRVDRVRLRHRLYKGGWSDVVQRELFVRQRAVAVLPFDPLRNEILLVEQFRIGALDWRDSPWCLELIAGIADKEGEDALDLVRREAQEEAGLTLGEMVPISRYMPSPGGSDERLVIYLARADLANAGGIFGAAEEGEDIRALVLPVAEIAQVMESGRVDNAASQIALYWFQLHGEQWRRHWGG